MIFFGKIIYKKRKKLHNNKVLYAGLLLNIYQ